MTDEVKPPSTQISASTRPIKARAYHYRLPAPAENGLAALAEMSNQQHPENIFIRRC
jgi:hypothetical protein